MLEPARYQPPQGRFDEAVAPDGSFRPGWAALGSLLAGSTGTELAERQRQLDRMLDAEGAGYLVHDMTAGSTASRPWRLDAVPLVLDQPTFDLLARAVEQRASVVEAMLADLYGQRMLVRQRVVPAEALYGLPSLQLAAMGRRPERYLVHMVVDLARVASGEWRVVQQLTDSPTGLGYSLLNRSVTSRVMGDALRSTGAAPVSGAAPALRRALAAIAPPDRSSPRTVVLTAGPEHSSYVEHSYLAVQMGVHLAQGADLVVRRHGVWLRALDGLEPVDVVYRRIEDAGVDPLDAHMAGANGVPAITWAAQVGGVALGNAFGSGLAEAPVLAALLGDVSQALTGEQLLLHELRADEELATTPVTADGDAAAVVPGRVVLRMHAVVGPDGVWVMPGGAGRVLGPHDHPASPTSLRTKDVWVASGRRVAMPVRVATAPQVDLRTSVPKRVADSLYWLARAAERAEVAARAARVVSAQVQQDPYLVALGDGGWLLGASALLRAARGVVATVGGGDANTEPVAEQLQRELDATQHAVANSIAALVQEAASVREYLSTTTGRVLDRLARVHTDLVSGAVHVDDLDLVLMDLAALSGLATESTVRGPAWRFMDMGRRIERALAVLGSIEAAAGPAVDPLAFQPLIEALLAGNESLVAYRRRYRSEVELDAVIDLLVNDDENPRGLAFQLDRLREHTASLGWAEGSDCVDRSSRAALGRTDAVVAGGRRLSVDALVLAARGPLLELDAAVVAHWFADPVNPMVMGAR